MSEVVSLADVKNDNRLLTAEQLLENALRDLRSGVLEADKLLLLTLSEDVGFYDPGFYACNMSASEMITLCTRSIHLFNKQMDGE